MEAAHQRQEQAVEAPPHEQLLMVVEERPWSNTKIAAIRVTETQSIIRERESLQPECAWTI